MDVLTYKGLVLSDFQIDAIKGVQEHKNVILSTHTGNGKTLVADFAVNQCFNAGKRVIYTAPIKALSNQKYNQFSKMYGAENVGLITGDRVINQDAGIIVATTEVLRNMMHEDRERIADIETIILDEIHYLGDKERGTVWEEIIIFKNKEARILGLSATIPNIEDLCSWIREIHDEPVEMVYYPERIVKQQHYYFDKRLGAVKYGGVMSNYLRQKRQYGGVVYKNTHLDFAEYALEQGVLPVLYFTFSRKQCEIYAKELAGRIDMLTKEERDTVRRMIRDYEASYPDIRSSSSWAPLKYTLMRGIGYHHAGLLPIVKQFMEDLFERKLCKFLYATETFAVGINYPVKTVCFDSLRKYDGESFRTLTGSEYLQMAGRAGRRGIDDFGLVYVLADYKSLENGNLPDISQLQAEPIVSKFQITYNTLVNLVSRYSDREIEEFFNKSFSNFQYDNNRKRQERADSINQSLEQLRKNLREYEPDPDCGIEDVNSCPVVFEQNLRRYNQLKKTQYYAKKQKADSSKIDELVETLEPLVTSCCDCDPDRQEACMSRYKKIRKIKKKIRKLERMLKSMEKSSPGHRFKVQYGKMTQVLRRLGYIGENRELLPRGIICSKIHVQEVLVTELIFDGFFHKNSDAVINGVVAGIANENNPLEESHKFSFDLSWIYSKLSRIGKEEMNAGLEPSGWFSNNLCGVVAAWTESDDWNDIISEAEIPEGDFVNICRRTTDLLRQIRNACSDDAYLKDKLNRCISRIDKGIVSLGL